MIVLKTCSLQPTAPLNCKAPPPARQTRQHPHLLALQRASVLCYHTYLNNNNNNNNITCIRSSNAVTATVTTGTLASGMSSTPNNNNNNHRPASSASITAATAGSAGAPVVVVSPETAAPLHNEDAWQHMTRTVAHYKRLEQIGEGTYGQVYRAICQDTGQPVALKKMRLLSGRGYWGMPLQYVVCWAFFPTVMHKHNDPIKLTHSHLLPIMIFT